VPSSRAQPPTIAGRHEQPVAVQLDKSVKHRVDVIERMGGGDGRATWTRCIGVRLR